MIGTVEWFCPLITGADECFGDRLKRLAMFTITSGIRVPTSSIGLGSTSIWEYPIAEHDDHQNQYANSGIVMLGLSAINQTSEESRPKVGTSSKEKARLNWGHSGFFT
jgi:hypothetical protein